MSRTLILLFFGLLISEFANSQLHNSWPKRNCPGIVVLSVQQPDLFSIVENPAILPSFTQLSVGFSGVRHYLLPELGAYQFVSVFPTKFGSIGVGLGYAGFTGFNTIYGSLLYGKQVNKKLYAGIGFHFEQIKIPSYFNKSSMSFTGSMLFKPAQGFQVGFRAFNPVFGSKPHADYSLGVGYDITNQFFFGADLIKQRSYPIRFKAGIRYRLHEKFNVFGGFSEGVYAGAGFLVAGFRVQFSCQYHQQLGVTPAISLESGFGKIIDNK